MGMGACLDEIMSRESEKTGYLVGKDVSMGKGFDYAVQQLKLGKKMKREGWNGKDQYIELASNVSFVDPNGVVHNVDHSDMGNKAIAFHGTSGIQLGWLASQSDVLSEDWVEA